MLHVFSNYNGSKIRDVELIEQFTTNKGLMYSDLSNRSAKTAEERSATMANYLIHELANLHHHSIIDGVNVNRPNSVYHCPVIALHDPIDDYVLKLSIQVYL